MIGTQIFSDQLLESFIKHLLNPIRATTAFPYEVPYVYQVGHLFTLSLRLREKYPASAAEEAAKEVVSCSGAVKKGYVEEMISTLFFERKRVCPAGKGRREFGAVES